MADVAVIVGGDTADIEPDTAFFNRGEGFLFSGQCIIYFHRKNDAQELDGAGGGSARLCFCCQAYHSRQQRTTDGQSANRQDHIGDEKRQAGGGVRQVR